MAVLGGPIRDTEELNCRSEQLREVLISAYESSCPLKARNSYREVPWWSRRLEELKREVRNLAKDAKSAEDLVG